MPHIPKKKKKVVELLQIILRGGAVEKGKFEQGAAQEFSKLPEKQTPRNVTLLLCKAAESKQNCKTRGKGWDIGMESTLCCQMK